MRPTDRRRFLTQAGGATLALLAARPSRARPTEKEGRKEPHETAEEEVSPTEDLMREHGVLRRLLLVYREAIRRLDAHEELKPEPIVQSAQILRAFIEDYHERDEEQYLFPRLKAAHQLVELVDVLVAQHQAGRKLSATILQLATPAGLSAVADRQRLVAALRDYVRMYEPHAAREDTVLFPAFRAIAGEKELDRLQKIFEQKEQALPRGGFEKMVADVSAIEQSLGINDLRLFTPKV